MPSRLAPKTMSSVPVAMATVTVSPSHNTATIPAKSGVVLRSGEAREMPTLLAEMNSRIWVQKGDSTPAPVNSRRPAVGASAREAGGPSTTNRTAVEVKSETEMALVGVP